MEDLKKTKMDNSHLGEAEGTLMRDMQQGHRQGWHLGSSSPQSPLGSQSR